MMFATDLESEQYGEVHGRVVGDFVDETVLTFLLLHNHLVIHVTTLRVADHLHPFLSHVVLHLTVLKETIEIQFSFNLYSFRYFLLLRSNI